VGDQPRGALAASAGSALLGTLRAHWPLPASTSILVRRLSCLVKEGQHFILCLARQGRGLLVANLAH
jgi:hypothetical protein